MAFRAAATNANCSGVVTAQPTGMTNGDHLTAYVVVFNTTDTVVGPAGWTRQVLQADTNFSLSQITVWTKIAASEPGTWTWTGISSYCDIAVWADNGATGIDASAGAAVNVTTTPPSPSITTTATSELVRSTMHCNGGISTPWTPPTGATLRFSYDGVSSGAEILVSAAGPTGAYTWGPVGSNAFVAETDALAVTPTAQFAYPASDVSAGSWRSNTGATTALYSYVDEPTTPNDSDYILSSPNPTSDQAELHLGTLTNPGVDTGHVLHVRRRQR